MLHSAYQVIIMISFLRKWYIIIAVVWWLCSVVAFYAFARTTSHLLNWILILNPVVVPTILLATRGFRQTTWIRVFVCTYAVALIPIGLFMFYGDVLNNAHNGWQDDWLNTWIWFQLVVEGVGLTSPFVIGFSVVVTCVNNLLVKDLGDE